MIPATGINLPLDVIHVSISGLPAGGSKLRAGPRAPGLPRRKTDQAWRVALAPPVACAYTPRLT